MNFFPNALQLISALCITTAQQLKLETEGGEV